MLLAFALSWRHLTEGKELALSMGKSRGIVQIMQI
jgi:hypothetical protein